MNIPERTQAILLLTAWFSKPRNDDPKPLTPTEWGQFAAWLNGRSLNPESLLFNDIHYILKGWVSKSITIDRLQSLLNRGAAMGIALEKWFRSGLWVLCRSDREYPERLKKRLKDNCPPILFGCGNQGLLNQCLLNQGLLNKKSCAVVGSRNANQQDLNFSRDFGTLTAAEGYSIVSGGARGVDDAAMMGALEKEGTVIGVLAHGLLKAATSAKFRKFIMDDKLVLVSPFYPEAGFNVGNAMSRNKYIYCLSEAAVVVHSGTKGGTWNGALENLRKRWVPLWVKKTEDLKAGNDKIAIQGGIWLSEDIKDIRINSLFVGVEQILGLDSNNLFSNMNNHEKQKKDATFVTDVRQRKQKTEAVIDEKNVERKRIVWDNSMREMETPNSIYHFFLTKIKNDCEINTKKPDEMQKELELTKKQLDQWLKRAVTEGKLEKLSRPVRYQWRKTQQRLPGM